MKIHPRPPSMLSALQANLFAASRIALAMARDRNLPVTLRRLDPRFGTPTAAVVATAATVMVILVLIPDVAAAGAAAELRRLLAGPASGRGPLQGEPALGTIRIGQGGGHWIVCVYDLLRGVKVDTLLGAGIVHLVAVAVQVIGRNVQ